MRIETLRACDRQPAGSTTLRDAPTLPGASWPVMVKIAAPYEAPPTRNEFSSEGSRSVFIKRFIIGHSRNHSHQIEFGELYQPRVRLTSLRFCSEPFRWGTEVRVVASLVLPAFRHSCSDSQTSFTARRPRVGGSLSDH